MIVTKKKIVGSILLFLTAVVLYLGITSFGTKGIKIKASPKDVLDKLVNNPALKSLKGESFCWNARVGMDDFLDNYLLTKDAEWLEAGFKYCDFLIGKMDTDPDGRKGWIGPYEYDTKYMQDALVGDAILLTGILDISVAVLEDAVLKAKYGEKAMSYVKIAKNDFAEKWDKRGCWYEDGPYGSYIGFNKYLKPENPKVWVTEPDVSRSGISHPFNKQMDAAQVFLRLWRITGNKFYRDRAERIYFTAKSHFQFFDNHYCWNYFEPLTPGDVDLVRKNTRHWIDVHPWKSGYQTGEVEKIVEAYNYGIVFDDQDIKRIINTNLNVMWNKDKENPFFISSNGMGTVADTIGLAAYMKVNGFRASFKRKNPGELWTGLLDFDQTIRDIYEVRFKNDNTSDWYLRYKNTVLLNPPGFKRKFVETRGRASVKVPVVKFTESKDLYCAIVLPYVVLKGGKSIILCKSRKPGELQIDLYSTKGKKINNLYNGKMSGEMFIFTWDGKDPAQKTIFKGDYKIRWTTESGYREFPIEVD